MGATACRLLEDEVANEEDDVPVEHGVVIGGDAGGRVQKAEKVERGLAYSFGAKELHGGAEAGRECDKECLDVCGDASKEGFMVGL